MKFLWIWALTTITALLLSTVTNAQEIIFDAGAIEGNVSFPSSEEGNIAILSFDFGVGQKPTNQAGVTSATQCQYDEVVLAKGLDNASPELIKAAALGSRLGNTSISVYAPMPTGELLEVLQLTFLDTVVLSSDISVNDQGGLPSEVVTLGFSDVRGTVTDPVSRIFEEFEITCF